MSTPPFDLTSEEFKLCSCDLQTHDNAYIFSVTIIDSYNKHIQISQIIDTAFFTGFESLVKQIIPSHESQKFYLYFNAPSNQIKTKIEYILKQLDWDLFIIDVNSKHFKEKIFDLWSNIKILFKNSETEQYAVTYNNRDYVFPLETLNRTVNFITILQYESFHNTFTFSKLNNKEFLGFDISCVNCLNWFNSFTERKTYWNTSTLQKLAKNTVNRNTNSGTTKSDVFSILNWCCTKFGSRILRTWLMQPLQSVELINNRLNIVEALCSCPSFNNEMRSSYWSKIDDLQTINMKISRYLNKRSGGIGSSSGSNSNLKLEDCAKLQRCIGLCKEWYGYIRNYEGVNQGCFYSWYVAKLVDQWKYLSKWEEMIATTIVYDSNSREYTLEPNLDKDLKNIRNEIDAKFHKIDDIKNYVENEWSKSNKKPPKIKVDQYINTGYILEITKVEGDEFLGSHQKFKRVSTNKRSIMINNTELIEWSNEIKTLKNESKNIENKYVVKVLDVIASYQGVLENFITLWASLDILSSFALLVTNSTFQYTKPIMSTDGTKIVLKDSRHLVLEYLKTNNVVIANDCSWTATSDNIHLITGINMGGKSTYLRQVGICVIWAHVGCFVPASYAEMPIIDQIFTRVGAGDLMLKGISTYMNEMIEVCSWIKSATSKSLLLIDELGRGTSTDDGIGISYAIWYHISQVINSYCLFATHFYELTKMEDDLGNVKNYYMSYNVVNGAVNMEYKVWPGKNDKSFGVGWFRSLNFDEKTCEVLDKFIEEEDGGMRE